MRVEVQNPSDGGVLYWLAKLIGFSLLALVTALCAAGAGLYLYFAHGLPPLPDLDTYAARAPATTRIVAQDGTVLAELASENRDVVPLSRIPPKLAQAFIAVEDRRFFEHGAVDPIGIARALWTNFVAGQVRQGGSTITQQVAKSYLGNERSILRKGRELVFARRLEARYGKDDVLALYLNQVFLGSGAFGVEAAARRYFDVHVDQLDVGEMALLAGLARSPSRDSPLVSPERARARRDTVLDLMAEAGIVTPAEAARWKATPLRLRPHGDAFLDTSPYFTQDVRSAIEQRFGKDAVYSGGLRVETTLLPLVADAADRAVETSARKLDERQGWHGPEAHLGPLAAERFRERAAARYGEPSLVDGRYYLGLVESVRPDGAEIRVGARIYPLPLANMAWAAPYRDDDSTNDRTIASATEALRRGDVVWVRSARRRILPFSDWDYTEEGEAVWRPPQERPRGDEVLALGEAPTVRASLFTFDHRTGYVLAEAGGTDFERSQFNAITNPQACRQPGSAFKPIYYSLALDRGYAYKTLLNDQPSQEIDPETGQAFTPADIGNAVDYRVTLESALVWSKNIPSVELFNLVGPRDVERWARRLGIAGTLNVDDALALGGSCVHQTDLSRAVAVFARDGRKLDLVTIRRVIGRDGRVLEDNTVPDDPWLAPDSRLDRVAATIDDTPEQAIPPRTAWLTSQLLRRCISDGHSEAERETGVIAAGKTGTGPRTWDVWLVGYTSRWLTTAWMGQEPKTRQLGYHDASFMLTLPLWSSYMYEATRGQKLGDIPWTRPEGVRPGDEGGPLAKGSPDTPEDLAAQAAATQPSGAAPVLIDGAPILPAGAALLPASHPKVIRVPKHAPPSAHPRDRRGGEKAPLE